MPRGRSLFLVASAAARRPTFFSDGDGRSFAFGCPTAMVPTAVYSSGIPNVARSFA